MDSENYEQTTASTFEILAEKDRRSLSRHDVFKKSKYIVLFACLVLIVAGITVVLVISLSRKVSDSQKMPPKEDESSSNRTDKRNAHEIFNNFLIKVHDAYYEVYPNEIYSKQNVTKEEIREKIRPFDFSPAALKRTADTRSQLRSELDTLFTAENEATLTQRELRALYEARTFLRHFQGPYDTMYYSGDWMLGPNTMAWQPIGSSFVWIKYVAIYFLRPRSVEEAEKFIEFLKQFKASTVQYMENMKMGVRAGMVRNIEACKGGLLRFKSRFHLDIGGNFESVIGSKSFFLKDFTDEMQRNWTVKYGENLTSFLEEVVVRYVTKPFSDLIRYMETEHMQHCVPSNVSSGLADLPLTHVYVNGVPDLSRPTNPYLPTGERLNGSKSFLKLLPYFTTNGITPKEIKALGEAKLKFFYEKALALAKQVTKETNSKIAVERFRALLTHRSQYFNNESFSANESIENAYLKCYDELSAQKYCPERWEAFTKWKESTMSINKILHQKIKPLFYTHGRKKTTLSDGCAAAVKPNFNPCSSYHNYQGRGCGVHFLPFFVDNYGPKFSEWTTTAHETEPGHNLEVRGYQENFEDKNKDIIKWLTMQTYFSGFSEGWATYSESPLIGEDIDAYRDDLMSKYGMLQQEIIAALRLIIETGLHYYGMTRTEALKLFDDYAWDNSDIAQKEITRYQSLQGHSVSYMVGQTALLKARTFAEKELGSNFTLPEFHYQVLHQGELTLDYLDRYIRHYVACVKSSNDPKGQVCDDVLGQ